MNQLLFITYNPNAGKLGELAPAERTFVKMGRAGGQYEDMFMDNVRAVREKYPDLPILVTPMIGDVLCFGQKRFVKKCVEVGVDGMDTAMYPAWDDPTHFRRDLEAVGINFVAAITGGAINMDDPTTVEAMDKMVRVSTGEIFFVPAVPGTKSELKGSKFAPAIKRVREVQDQYTGRYPIIAIGGMNTAEDAYEAVKVAGMDGIHFSSAWMKRLFANEPLEKIETWLKEVKAAIND